MKNIKNLLAALMLAGTLVGSLHASSAAPSTLLRAMEDRATDASGDHYTEDLRTAIAMSLGSVTTEPTSGEASGGGGGDCTPTTRRSAAGFPIVPVGGFDIEILDIEAVVKKFPEPHVPQWVWEPDLRASLTHFDGGRDSVENPEWVQLLANLNSLERWARERFRYIPAGTSISGAPGIIIGLIKLLRINPGLFMGNNVTALATTWNPGAANPYHIDNVIKLLQQLPDQSTIDKLSLYSETLKDANLLRRSDCFFQMLQITDPLVRTKLIKAVHLLTQWGRLRIQREGWQDRNHQERALIQSIKEGSLFQTAEDILLASQTQRYPITSPLLHAFYCWNSPSGKKVAALIYTRALALSGRADRSDAITDAPTPIQWVCISAPLWLVQRVAWLLKEA